MTSKEISPQRNPGVFDGPVCELEQILREMISHHEHLSRLAEVRHEAMRRANMEALGACIQCENEVVQQIADTEKRRVRVVGVIAAELGSPAKSQTRMSWIAERCPEPARKRLLTLAATLRETIGVLHKRNEVVRSAAEALARHMNGIRRQIGATLNHARTYGRRGAVDPGPSVVSAVDLRS